MLPPLVGQQAAGCCRKLYPFYCLTRDMYCCLCPPPALPASCPARLLPCPCPPPATGLQVTQAALRHDIEDAWRLQQGTLGCHASTAPEVDAMQPSIFGGYPRRGAALLLYCCCAAGAGAG